MRSRDSKEAHRERRRRRVESRRGGRFAPLSRWASSEQRRARRRAAEERPGGRQRPVLDRSRPARQSRCAELPQRQQQREQEHAPPTILPPGTIAVYTDGSAEKRSKDDPGSAGYGVCVIDHCNDGNKDEQGEVRAKRSNRFDQQVSSDFYLHTWKFHFHSQDQIQSRRLSQLFSGFHTRIHNILPILVKFLQVFET